MIAGLNALGLDLATFGNHEFDFGPTVLGRAHARVEVRMALGQRARSARRSTVRRRPARGDAHAGRRPGRRVRSHDRRGREELQPGAGGRGPRADRRGPRGEPRSAAARCAGDRRRHAPGHARGPRAGRARRRGRDPGRPRARAADRRGGQDPHHQGRRGRALPGAGRPVARSRRAAARALVDVPRDRAPPAPRSRRRGGREILRRAGESRAGRRGGRKPACRWRPGAVGCERRRRISATSSPTPSGRA